MVKLNPGGGAMEQEQIQEIEITLLLEALYLRYGYDFRDYDRTTLTRRILTCLDNCYFQKISEIIPRLIHHGEFLNRLIHALSVNTTEMFRDPATFAALRQQVFPHLASYPLINIWHAGCATGEEVYSLAILLHEADLLSRTRIYATDIDEEVLTKAREGIYSAAHLPQFEENYLRAGGTGLLRDYLIEEDEVFRLDEKLRHNMVFANHNLVTDGVFAEVHLLLCRNVLIYFNSTLRERALRLFHDSLSRGGYLCLGHAEALPMHGWKTLFLPLAPRERIFRKALALEPPP
ncbi:MAG: protein-glutamate O-methyltransferase CheR [Magnetococcales bacterium]|nr:protein-glutamate O-methyltransferase CheR [Magnetococcales bacterium]